MFQRQGMFLKRGMPVGHGRVAGVAGLRGKTEIGNVQIPQLLPLANRVKLPVAGMQRQQQKYGQSCCGKEQELN
jgi:hypothetical protein